MNTTSQFLESVKYFSQQLVTCLCCGNQHPAEGDRCTNCQAPMELSRTMGPKDSPPEFITVLGASGAGKSVYLGVLLDLLSNGVKGLKGFANGAFSIAVQQNTMAALEQRHFPQKTPSEADLWNWVHCQLAHESRPKRVYDFVTPDMAGEAIAQEIHQSGTYPAIYNVTQQSKGILLLCDSQRVCQASVDEDLLGLTMLSYVFALHDDGSKKSQREVSIAVVFTKTDLCPEARDDPAQFAVNNVPRMVQFCKNHRGRHKFFATSVVGSSALMIDEMGCETQIAFHVEPRGVVEPLDWIIRGT